MVDTPLARLPNESGKAHDALLTYAELGAQRSMAKAAQALGKSKGYIGQLENWSRQHRWQERVAAHDAAIAQERQRRMTESYLEGIEEYRDRYQKIGKELFAVSRHLLGKFVSAADAGELSVSNATLNTIVRALHLSAEIEAHSLSLDRLLPTLDYADPDVDDDPGICVRCGRHRLTR